MNEQKPFRWALITNLTDAHRWAFENEGDADEAALAAIKSGADYAVVAKITKEFKPGIEITRFE